MTRFLFLDTETTGRPVRGADPQTAYNSWPFLVEIGWILTDEDEIISNYNELIIPDRYIIPEEVVRIHGITTEKATKDGVPLVSAMIALTDASAQSDIVVAHNAEFDVGMIVATERRLNARILKRPVDTVCTMLAGTGLCKIPSPYGGYKWPRLTELYQALFGETPEQDHRALADVELTMKCFFEMRKLGLVTWSEE